MTVNNKSFETRTQNRIQNYMLSVRNIRHRYEKNVGQSQKNVKLAPKIEIKILF